MWMETRSGAVVRNGRPEKGMPPFDFSDEQDRQPGGVHPYSTERGAVAETAGAKGVDVSDLQTGNAEAGKQYFEGAGGCANCHSPTGDLAGIASRYQGLELEKRMLYPGGREVQSDCDAGFRKDRHRHCWPISTNLRSG